MHILTWKSQSAFSFTNSHNSDCRTIMYWQFTKHSLVLYQSIIPHIFIIWILIVVWRKNCVWGSEGITELILRSIQLCKRIIFCPDAKIKIRTTRQSILGSLSKSLKKWCGMKLRHAHSPLLWWITLSRCSYLSLTKKSSSKLFCGGILINTVTIQNWAAHKSLGSACWGLIGFQRLQ